MIVPNFKTDIQTYKEKSGKTWEQIAKENNISSRYLRYLRSGKRKGMRGKGIKIKQKARNYYKKHVRIYHFFYIVPSTSPPLVVFKSYSKRTTDPTQESKPSNAMFYEFGNTRSKLQQIRYDILIDYGDILANRQELENKFNSLIPEEE